MKSFQFGALALAMLAAMSPLPAADARPNVVIFLADDAGWGDYAHSGNQQVSTPNIDSIARDGVSFDHFYVCTVCSPTRAEFLTGRYHPRGGVSGTSVGQERLNLDEKTIADAFQAAGYATGAFGKWHNGSQWPYHPMARGFNEYVGHTAGHWGEYFNAPLEENGHMVRTEGYIADVCTDRALAFIDRNKDRPFFCYLPFTTPHAPWAVPEKDWGRFKNKEISQLANPGDAEDLDVTRCVLAMIENQDENVGRVLSELKSLGLEENTIVLYFSDNGPNSARWNGGLKGKKGQLDEGGLRSVCFLRWPQKIAAGHTVPQIAGAIDLLPTLTTLAGIPRVGDKPIDGLDLTPLLRQEKVEWPDRKLYSTWNGKLSVRSEQYRLDADGHLFDIVSDPGQTTPIEDQNSNIAAALTKDVKAWRKEVLGSFAPPAARKGKARNNRQVDPRPIPVGYREFPITMLPARDAEPHGGIQRSASAPNCSYFVNWTSLDDKMVWKLDVETTGRYEVTIDYTCPLPDVGSLVELTFQAASLQGRVQPGWDPPLYTNQDTLPRPAPNSQMKDFHTLNLGVIELPKGEGELTLHALEIPGRSVMDVRRVTLTLLP